MPRGGHNAKPTPIRELQGTLRPDRTRNEPTFEPVATLHPPAGLDEFGKQAWRKYAPMLRDKGMLTEADVPALSAFCGAYSRWRRVSLALAKAKPDADNFRSLSMSVERAEHSMRLLANEFGMSPASRSRLDVTWSDGPTGEATEPMEDILNGRRSAS